MYLKLAKIIQGFWLKEKFLKLHIHLLYMKNIQELKSQKVPVVCIDPSLEKYRENTPFPEKLEKVNKILKTVKLPNKKPRN
jgi:hypothetical protein